MAKRQRNRADSGNEPVPPSHNDIRRVIDACFTNYNPAEGRFYLSLGFNLQAIQWVLWRLNKLSGLRTLEMAYIQIGDEGAEALANSKHLSTLRKLNIAANEIRDKGLTALAGAEHLSSLNTLNIGHNEIRDEGAQALAGSEHLVGLCKLNIEGNQITNPLIIVHLCKLILRSPSSIRGDKIRKRIIVCGNPLRWPDMDAPVSPEILKETDPKRLYDMLLELSRYGRTVAAARVVTAGVSGAGKTHLRKRLTEPTSPELTRPLTTKPGSDGKHTIGAVICETQLTREEHGRAKLPDITLVVVDVGGHREQLQAHHKFVYLAGQSVFLLCLHARKPFDGWGKYYLEMIQDLTLLRYSEKMRQSYRLDHAKERMPDVEKAPVIIVPTHSDAPTTGTDLKVEKAELEREYKLLNIIVAKPVNNLTDTSPIEVRKKIGEQLEKQPYIATAVLKETALVRDDVQKLFRESVASGAKPPNWISRARLKSLCKRRGVKDFDLTVRELLRLGDVVVPLKEMPDETQRVSDRIDRILNPHFVFDYLYRIITDEKTEKQRGFMSEERFEKLTETLKQPGDRKLLHELLTQYMVVLKYEEHGREAGFFVPDLFKARPAGTFEPWCDAEFDQPVSFNVFVPEHAFFKFVARCGTKIKPIDEEDHQYLFRDACFLKWDDVQVQVYADVLHKLFRVTARGPRKNAIEIGLTLIRWIEESVGTKAIANEQVIGNATGRRTQSAMPAEEQMAQNDSVNRAGYSSTSIGISKGRVCRIAVDMHKAEILLDGKIIERAKPTLCFVVEKLIKANGSRVSAQDLLPASSIKNNKSEPGALVTSLLQNISKDLRKLIKGVPGVGGRYLTDRAFTVQ